MEKIIEVNNLKRNYTIKEKIGFFQSRNKTIEAVKGIDFCVEKGEIFGLLGENGAGKTTTIKMLTTLLAPTEGICRVLGFNTFGEEKNIRRKINFIFGGETGVYRRLSAKDNLIYFSNLYLVEHQIQVERINELLKLVGLFDVKDNLVETYSKGMIQRLQIARGLINNPEVLFMDEPTVGLDPVGAHALREIILRLKARGCTILLTTHYLQEAEELCDHIAIMKAGKIVSKGTPQEIKGKCKNLEEAYLKLMEEKENAQ